MKFENIPEFAITPSATTVFLFTALCDILSRRHELMSTVNIFTVFSFALP